MWLGNWTMFEWDKRIRTAQALNRRYMEHIVFEVMYYFVFDNLNSKNQPNPGRLKYLFHSRNHLLVCQQSPFLIIDRNDSMRAHIAPISSPDTGHFHGYRTQPGWAELIAPSHPLHASENSRIYSLVLSRHRDQLQMVHRRPQQRTLCNMYTGI